VCITLLRHGATVAEGRYCGSTDVVLSERGWAQSWAAVAGGAWDRIVTSPASRCAAFAEALAVQLAVPCRRDARLREMHFGAWEGRSASELMATDADALRRFWEDPLRYPPPQSEPLAELRARMMSCMCELSVADDTNAESGRTLVVTHGGPIRLMLAALAGMPLSHMVRIEVPYAARFEIDVSALARVSAEFCASI
jgi:broad specificity phosphatase PhoE